jgi:hypothetical protein
MLAEMRYRASFIVVMLLAVALRTIPCDAMTARVMSSHECCDEQCPDLLTQNHDRTMSDEQAKACCAMSDSRRQQQDSRLLTTAVTLAQPEPSIAFVQPQAVAITDHVDFSPPPPRSAPLHLLFAVFLV